MGPRPDISQHMQTLTDADASAARALEKELLLQRMAELAEEIESKRRTIMGSAVPLPPVGTITRIEVTAGESSRHGAFVACEFGSGFLHAKEASRSAIQIRRAGTTEDSRYALIGNEATYVAVRQPARVMESSALVASLLPVGRRAWAEVTCTEGGQLYFSMRDIDQSQGARRAPLAAEPLVGQSVMCVVAHVNTPPGPAWAVCKLLDYYSDGEVVQAFLPADACSLDAHWLQAGDVLDTCVTRIYTDDEGVRRIRLRAGVDRAKAARERKAASKQAKAHRKRVREQQAQGRSNHQSLIGKGVGKRKKKKKQKNKGMNKGTVKAELEAELAVLESATPSSGATPAAPWPSASEARTPRGVGEFDGVDSMHDSDSDSCDAVAVELAKQVIYKVYDELSLLPGDS